MNALVPITPQPTNAEIYRASTDAAGLCKAIVLQTTKKIGDRNYVSVEGWEAIAVAHGCAASSRGVESISEGVRAIGEVRRMSDGVVIAQAEGFVGKDEPTWYGGTMRAWKWGEERGQKVWYDKTTEKRPDYAIRAMAQTRAISRACRSAFAHVVVLIDANLSTTPAEEVPDGGFDDATPPADLRDVTPKTQAKSDPKPKGAARDKAKAEEPNPPELSAGATAAIAAIKAIKTESALGDWGVNNGPMIKAMDAPDALAVRQAYGVALEAFRRAAEEEAAKGDAPAEDDPFGAPGATAQDEPPPAWTPAQSAKWRDEALKAIAACKTDSELRAWNDAEEANIQQAIQADYDVVGHAWGERAKAIAKGAK